MRRFLNAQLRRRDHLHPQRHRGDQSGRLVLRRADIGEGDEIVLTIMEHHSNIVPWHFHPRAPGRGAEMGAGRPTTASSCSRSSSSCSRRAPRSVAITHMSNVLGTVVPVKEVVRIAHARGIPVLVDGSQAAVHLPVDVQDLDVDFYAFTGHKLYGPTGIGVLYGKKEHLERDAALSGRRRDDRRRHHRRRSPTPSRRTDSRPARRRSSRRSGSAPPSTTSRASAASASRRTRTSCSTTPCSAWAS